MSEKGKLSGWDIVGMMMEKDAFSKWLGIELVVVEQGYAKIKMTVREEMLNGFGIAHGGIAFSLADSALAFASNGHGQKALSISTSITHFKGIKAEDVLIAETRQHNIGEKIAHYQVVVTNQDQEEVALFSGSVYRTSKTWEAEE